MNDLTSIFSSGMSHLLTFSIGAGAAVIGISLATRAVEYAKSFVGMSDPFSYVSSVNGVEYGDFGDFSIRYGNLYFESEADLNDHFFEERASNSVNSYNDDLLAESYDSDDYEQPH